ncbi:MAG: 16S rRNA (cytosine(967)-C(5))-methyltransferase RsmB [Gammaproteobacteria bacterium]|nr:16S rRNA (cytosine(967)-C(5))-methyltransferase RsmB [Gammaproteobacteria bacterium]
MNTRALAARILVDVHMHGVSLTDALANRLAVIADVQDQSFVQEICYGVSRWWWRLDAMLALLLDKPLKSKDADINHLIMTGLYQLQYMRVPDHAAVAETVAGCVALNKSWAKNLVNAVLRNYQRRAEQLRVQLQDNPVAEFSHPQWLLDAIRNAWPQHWQSVLQANNAKPPMMLRVNRLRVQRSDYLQQLAAAGISAAAAAYNDNGVILEKPAPVTQLPGFTEGLVSVQDGAAQLAATLLQLAPQQRVLDVCAAPGGKTAHILEIQPDLQLLVAVDVDAERLKKVSENLQRLGVKASIRVGDGQSPQTWWDGQAFDRILLDAPCSATGVIRRHPDIKRLRKPPDIQHTVETQRRILNAVWPLLKSGGMILYATCSILPRENEQQIRDFLLSHPDAMNVELTGAWGMPLQPGRQILPGQDDMDGFYYACIKKK